MFANKTKGYYIILIMYHSKKSFVTTQILYQQNEKHNSKFPTLSLPHQIKTTKRRSMSTLNRIRQSSFNNVIIDHS